MKMNNHEVSNAELSRQIDEIFEAVTSFTNPEGAGKEVCDDNGKPFVTKDGTYIPNNEYDLGGVHYETDDSGSIYKADGKYFPNDWFVLNGEFFQTDENGDIIQTETSERYEPNSYVSIDGERYRTDDNGKVYQKRNPETGTYEGLPNTSYELNGYNYETDERGRIKKAGGTLQERNHEGRPTINDNVNGMESNDEKGHLIGDQFNGSNLNGNLVAMDFDVNRSDYKKLEEKLSKCVNAELKKVEYRVEPEYEGNSERPAKLVVTYTIDGETFKETFKN